MAARCQRDLAVARALSSAMQPCAGREVKVAALGARRLSSVAAAAIYLRRALAAGGSGTATDLVLPVATEWALEMPCCGAVVDAATCGLCPRRESG
jgi:nicotinic acid phosphoribosyltransferase